MKLFTALLIFQLYSTLPSSIEEVSCGKLSEAFNSGYSALLAALDPLRNNKTTTESPLKSTTPGNDMPIRNLTSGTLNSNIKTSSISSNNADGKKQQRTCACDDNEEALICANNGVTYKNVCRFECAKARVERLRQVKEGRCSQGAGAQSYWQSNKSG